MGWFQAWILLKCNSTHLHELGLVLVEHVSSDGSQLSVLPDLVGGAGAVGVAVHEDAGLLAQVEPQDLPVLGVGGPGHLLQTRLHPGSGGLAAAVHLVAGHPSEVGHAGYRVPELDTVVRTLLQGISKFFATSRNSFMFSSCNCVSLR